MARLYWSFETNVESKNDELMAPQLDKLIFKTNDGNYLHISCSYDSSYGIDDGVHNGEWKGLEYRLENAYGEDIIEDWCQDDNTEEFAKLLDGAEPVAFFIDEDDLNEHCYAPDFIPTCKNVDIEIECMDHTFTYHADELMEEGLLIEQIRENREGGERV